MTDRPTAPRSVTVRRLTVTVPASRRAEAHMLGRVAGKEVGRALAHGADAPTAPVSVDGAGAPPSMVAARLAATLTKKGG